MLELKVESQRVLWSLRWLIKMSHVACQLPTFMPTGEKIKRNDKQPRIRLHKVKVWLYLWWWRCGGGWVYQTHCQLFQGNFVLCHWMHVSKKLLQAALSKIRESTDNLRLMTPPNFSSFDLIRCQIHPATPQLWVSNKFYFIYFFLFLIFLIA